MLPGVPFWHQEDTHPPRVLFLFTEQRATANSPEGKHRDGEEEEERRKEEENAAERPPIHVTNP